MLIKISSFLGKGVITSLAAGFSSLVYWGVSNKSMATLPSLTNVARGGQQITENSNSRLENTLHSVSTVLEEDHLQPLKKDESKDHFSKPIVIQEEKIIYSSTKKGNPDEPVEKTQPPGDTTKNLDQPVWISHLLKTLETPMYSRGNVSFVSSLKAEFATKLESHQDFSSSEEKKYVYQLNLSSAADSEDKYKTLSWIAKKWFGKQDSDFTLRYKAEQQEKSKGLKIIFLKKYAGTEYSLEIEYSYDSLYSGPNLHTNYVSYSESDWWKGGYYQGEGGQGWQKHIGKTDYLTYGNADSPINLSFVNTFSSGNWEGLTFWWKLLSKCTEEKYCLQSLTDTKSTYIQLPENYYRDRNLNKYSGEFHPLVLLWKEMNSIK